MPGNKNEIHTFFHCRLCLEEKPPRVSARDYARLEVGFTPAGVQVWCVRHDANVVNIDYEGHKHPANMTRDRTDG
jgi:hypothetical protein